jgi:hypothetical protein
MAQKVKVLVKKRAEHVRVLEWFYDVIESH